MKNIISVCLLTVTLLITMQSSAITIYIENDSREHLMTRVKFQKKDGNFYWTDWVHVPDRAKITSVSPDDGLLGFTIFESKSPTDLANLKTTDGASRKGYTYLLIDFRPGPTHEQMSQLAYDTQITVRDTKIEINATIPDKNIIWFGEIKR